MSSKATVEMYKKAGICTSCGSEEAEPNKTMCFECLEKRRINSRRYREKMTLEERKEAKRKKSEAAKILYAKRKKEGTCVICGKRKSVKWALCLDCYVKRERKKHTGISRTERPAYGQCFVCASPVVENKKMCGRCIEKYKLNLAKANEAKKNKEHTWNRDNKLVFSSGQVIEGSGIDGKWLFGLGIIK